MSSGREQSAKDCLPTFNTRWTKPPSGTVKTNADVAFVSKTEMAGMTAVARDHFGLLIEGAGQRKRVASVMATETEAIKLALLLANQQGWRKIIIETDSQLL